MANKNSKRLNLLNRANIKQLNKPRRKTRAERKKLAAEVRNQKPLPAYARLLIRDVPTAGLLARSNS